MPNINNLNVKIPISKVMDRLAVNVYVTGMRPWNVRMNIALWLIRLAAWVAPLEMTVETVETVKQNKDEVGKEQLTYSEEGLLSPLRSEEEADAIADQEIRMEQKEKK